MRTRIISAFPGVGKTYYHLANPKTTLDSDSSDFSWVIKDNGDKIRNPDFPENYIQHIKENIGKYEFIFVSSHAEVRKALQDNCLFFYLIYPHDSKKEEFIQRYKDRGSPESFVNLVSDNWDKWTNECRMDEIGNKTIRMNLKNLEHELNHIIRSENGDKK